MVGACVIHEMSGGVGIGEKKQTFLIWPTVLRVDKTVTVPNFVREMS